MHAERGLTVASEIVAMTILALPQDPMKSADRLHYMLDARNRRRFEPVLEPFSDGASVLPSSPHAAHVVADSDGDMARLEARFVEGERVRVKERAAEAPSDADGFVAWFEELIHNGEGQGHPLFDWLECEATLHQMTWFLRQEVAGEAGFEDLLALTQVRMPARAKLEMARNFWDEMGQGHASAMHGPMLAHLAQSLGIAISTAEPPVWESLALANLMAALATQRHYAYQSIGALGVIELTAPERARKVNLGLQRLAISGTARQYYALHATVDIRHSRSWNKEILHPLVSADPRRAQPIAEGALMRLAAGARCFARYVCELRLPHLYVTGLEGLAT